MSMYGHAFLLYFSNHASPGQHRIGLRFQSAATRDGGGGKERIRSELPLSIYRRPLMLSRASQNYTPHLVA